MGCVFEYKGKHYNPDELVGALKNAPLHEISDFIPGVNKIPNAPFKKTWDELALKRVLNEAATKGYDAVSWTPGEAQAARYDLSKSLDYVEYSSKAKSLIAYDKNGNKAIEHRDVIPEKLSDYIGKEAAEKIMNNPTKKEGEYHTLENADLKVGGEGMKAFYDKMLVDKANALVKKMGGKVEYENIGGEYKIVNKNGFERNFNNKVDAEEYVKYHPEIKAEIKSTGQNQQKIPIIKITPQMREQIQSKGFPLYSSGVPTFTPVEDPFKKKQPKLIPVEGNPFVNQ